MPAFKAEAVRRLGESDIEHRTGLRWGTGNGECGNGEQAPPACGCLPRSQVGFRYGFMDAAWKGLDPCPRHTLRTTTHGGKKPYEPLSSLLVWALGR